MDRDRKPGARIALLLAVGLSILVAVFWKSGAPAGSSVRLVLVTLDTLRWDSFSGIDGWESAGQVGRRGSTVARAVAGPPDGCRLLPGVPDASRLRRQ